LFLRSAAGADAVRGAGADAREAVEFADGDRPQVSAEQVVEQPPRRG